MSELKLHIKKEAENVEMQVEYTGNYVMAIRNMAALQYELMGKLVKNGNGVADVTTEMMVVFHEMMCSFVNEHEPEAICFVEAMGLSDLN